MNLGDHTSYLFTEPSLARPSRYLKNLLHLELKKVEQPSNVGTACCFSMKTPTSQKSPISQKYEICSTSRELKNISPLLSPTINLTRRRIGKFQILQQTHNKENQKPSRNKTRSPEIDLKSLSNGFTYNTKRQQLMKDIEKIENQIKSLMVEQKLEGRLYFTNRSTSIQANKKRPVFKI